MVSRAIFCAAFLALGCGDSWHSGRARSMNREFGSLEFKSSRWKTADAETRRQMVASLIESRILDLATRNEVSDSLGPSECHEREGTDACYVVTKGDRRYHLELAFSSTGPSARVVGIGIGEPVRTVRSVWVQPNTR
jgi:hypothetical protein